MQIQKYAVTTFLFEFQSYNGRSGFEDPPLNVTFADTVEEQLVVAKPLSVVRLGSKLASSV